jgi:hypothetical protein
LWNEDADDLLSCLRVLVCVRHDPLVRDFAKDQLRDGADLPSFISQDEIKGHPSLKNPAGGVVGYGAKIKPTSNHYVNVCIFSEIKQDAISN